MDTVTKEVLNYDLSHLTQQQIHHLHTLKEIARNEQLKVNLMDYIARLNRAK